MSHKIFIAGAGGIGEAAALLLRERSALETEIYLGDVSAESLEKVRNFVVRDSEKTSPVETVLMTDAINEAMKRAFEKCDVLLDCSPGSKAPQMARWAKDYAMHYANLTEYVSETDEIIELATNAETGFILQTGLAPGFINVLAMSLYNQFVEQFAVERVEKIGMKVGALSAHAHAPHFYGFTWSPIGVATEYVKTSRVIRDYAITTLPALSAREEIIIGARHYEADLTSGGAADLPDYFAGKAKNLDYKTLRYEGHYEWVERVIGELPADENLSLNLQARMLKEIPSVEDDLVLAHASVEGFDSDGRRRLIEKAFYVEPLEIGGKRLRAIQTTTAAPLLESAMMLLTGNYKGVILQSELDPADFLNGVFVKSIFIDS